MSCGCAVGDSACRRYAFSTLIEKAPAARKWLPTAPANELDQVFRRLYITIGGDAAISECRTLTSTQQLTAEGLAIMLLSKPVRIACGRIVDRMDDSRPLSASAIVSETKLVPDQAYACNFLVGPAEQFIRISTNPTPILIDERDDGKWLHESIEVKTGHYALSRDITVVEAAGELRFRVIRENADGTVSVAVFGTNRQSSFFFYPDRDTLKSLHRFGIGSELYRTNKWEVRGREWRRARDKRMAVWSTAKPALFVTAIAAFAWFYRNKS